MDRANQLNGSEWLKNSISVWRDFVKDKDSKDHPAPFPIGLVSKLIDCYVANRSGVLLDPFAGSGSALIAALNRGMSAVGADVNVAYRDLFRNRLDFISGMDSEWVYEVQDARFLSKIVEAGSVEICITSPPYWDILSRRRSADGKSSRPYSHNEHDLGNISEYDFFLSALGEVVQQVELALRLGGYFILNVMDIRKGGQFYPLHNDAILSINSQTNLTLEDIIIWDRQSDYNAMRPLGYPSKFIINKVHEYLLVFRNREGKYGKET